MPNTDIESVRRSPTVADQPGGGEDKTLAAPVSPGRTLRVLAVWAAGLILATLGAWVASAIWLSPYLPYVWEPALNRYVVAPGLYRQWEEGDGTTRIGRFGIAAIPDVTHLKNDTVLIWGDSYVEAAQVDDSEKMPQVLTREWNAKHPDRPLTAVGVGMRGWGLADIYFQLPQFEPRVPRVRFNFLVIGQINDLNPDRATRESKFVSDPASLAGYKFKESHWTPRFEKLKQFLMRLRLQVAWEMLKRISETELRFVPGRATKPSPGNSRGSGPIPINAWRFALGQLRDQAGAPLVVVYLPRLPSLAAEGRIATDDPSPHEAEMLRRLCAEMGIPLIDLTEDFIEIARSNRRFPHGFGNTIPWTGHLNADGHRLVARAISRYLEGNLR